MAWETVVIPVIAAVVYAVAGYLAQVSKPDNTEPFVWQKFLATAVVGLVIGFIAWVTGVEVTMEMVGQQILLYAGLIALIQKFLLGAVINSLRK
jgi:hypothetical protein